MKLRKVENIKETGYPTYLNYLRDHKKELGIIAAGVGLMLLPGCDENKQPNRTAGTPQPPIVVPVDKPVTLDGEMAAPIAPKPQTCPAKNTPQIGGKIKPPTPPKTLGRPVAPQPPTATRGELPAVKPPENIKGDMPAPIQEEKEK